MGSGLDVLVVDFDAAFGVPTLSALRAVGARTTAVLSHEASAQTVQDSGARAVVLSASSFESPVGEVPVSLFDARVPILGICNGAQVLASAIGAAVLPLDRREIGWVHLSDASGTPGLLQSRNLAPMAYMHHEFEITGLPAFVHVCNRTQITSAASFEFAQAGNWRFGTQYHPEVDDVHGGGRAQLRRFLLLARWYAFRRRLEAMTAKQAI